jgi:hypothetical protein
MANEWSDIGDARLVREEEGRRSTAVTSMRLSR